MDPRARLARLARLWARASAAVVLSAAGGVRNLLLQCAAVLDRRYGAAFATAKGEILSFDAVALQRQTAQLYDTAAGAVADAFADIDDRFDVNVRLQGTLSAAAGALRWAIPVQPPEVAKQADSPAKASARKFFFGGPQASPVAPRWGAKVQESLPQQTANKAQRFARRVFDAGRRAADSRRPLRAAHAHAPQRRRAVSSDTGGNCANAASLAVLAVLAADHAAQIQEAFENIVRIAGAAATAAADEAQRPLAAPLVAAPIELFQPPPPPPFQPPGGD
ncbi:hypothetical protein M885DRAFT_497609 [Pelagophyceae sp. CCMP2097]|nr:hypothetical protein M885DRAFT_497609 [Pelagophyceae sp. CCMP2097]